MLASKTFLMARDLLLARRTDFDGALAGFEWPQVSQFNWAFDYFDPLAATNDALALWIVHADGSDEKLSFAELSRRSGQSANFLRRIGVRRGDRILLMLGNEAALWESLLAAMKLGAAVIPATPQLTPADLADRMARGKVRHVIAGAVDAAKFDGLAGTHGRIAVGERVPGWAHLEDARDESAEFEADGPTAREDEFLLYFTSGTTSRPKLVVGTQQSYPIGHLSTMYWLGLRRGDLHWNLSSPGWAKHSWSSFFAPWNAAASVFALDYSRFSARAVLDALHAYPVSSFCAPPTVWRMLVQEPLGPRPPHLRELASAGEPLNPEVTAHIRQAWGIGIREGYGQTETTAVIGTPPGLAVKPGAMGRALPGYRVALLDDNGAEAAEGEICIALAPRPLGLMTGYADAPERNTQAMRDGYYHTGDLARRDDAGYITYVGRSDDVFKVSDYRISPFELESALIEHPAVAEAAVVPSPDAVRLAVPKAFVSLAHGYAPSRELAGELLGFARQRLAPFQRIRRIEFSELPKTISGKIRRVELRSAEQARDPTGPRPTLEFGEDEFSCPG